MGAALPFAANPTYRQLGVDWASSLLGFVAIAMSAIPFTFWIFGEGMLRRSRWAQGLAQQKEEA